MRRYRIKYTGFSKQNNAYTAGEKIVESDIALYPSELLSYIICDIADSENICNNFSIDCEEIPEDREKWGILS